MSADSKTQDAEKDPVTLALEDPVVMQRLHAAARASLDRIATMLSSIQRIEEANEIVSNAIKAVLKRRHDYNHNHEVVTWIVGFINNVAREHMRRYLRNPTGPPPDSPQLEDLACDLGRPVSDRVADKELADVLLNQLSPGDRQLLEMKYTLDLTFAEIAERMGMKESAARVKHHRLLGQLRLMCAASGEVQS